MPVKSHCTVGFHVAPDLHAGSRTDLRVYCIVVEESHPALTVRETTCPFGSMLTTRTPLRPSEDCDPL